MGHHDINLDARPINVSSSLEPTIDNSSSYAGRDTDCCRHVQQDSAIVDETIKSGDHLLNSLRQYYSDVTTKRQLNMETPAGFRQNTNLQKLFNEFLPPTNSSASGSTLVPDSSSLFPTTTDTASSVTLPTTPFPSTNTSSSAQCPILRYIDKPSSSLPSRIAFSEDYLHASGGFHRIDIIKKCISDLYQDTISMANPPADAVLDKGDFATLRKSARNTVPVPRPAKFGYVMHMDIVFGPTISLGNIHYGLLFTDRYSRMTYIYPLQTLTSDIRKQIEAFFAHLAFSPKRLITDFDTNLIGGKARESQWPKNSYQCCSSLLSGQEWSHRMALANSCCHGSESACISGTPWLLLVLCHQMCSRSL